MRRSSEQRLLRLAHQQFQRCEDFEGSFLKAYADDIKFANGDPDNGWQWPNQLFLGRRASAKPTLTVNQIRYFNNLIINEIKKTPPGITVRPFQDTSVKAAQIYGNIIRGVWRRSRGNDIAGRAARSQVDGGVAYWRVLTRYEHPMSRNLTPYVASIKDMMSVFIDPDAKEPDKCDAKFGFVFEDVLKEAVHKQYPKVAERHAYRNTNYLKEFKGWIGTDYYRVAEWYNLEETPDEIVFMVVKETGEEVAQYLSAIPEELREDILADPLTERRKTMRKNMRWYKIVGDTIVDDRDWPGIYLPLVQVVGDEVVIEGTLDRKGNTRLLKDAQRMDNYWMSGATEHLALQGKTPWLVDLRAIEGFETYYASANIQNHAYLPYKSFDADGQPINKPERATPPEFSQAYLQGMMIAAQKLALISGQRNPGQPEDPGQSDVSSGRAILARKEMGETSNFNFRDNLAIGVSYTGKILLDMIPRVMDTERTVKAVAEDGEEQDIKINPGLQQAILEKKREDEENVMDVEFNPSIGVYDIEAEAGPDWASQRQYAVEALGLLVSRNQELWGMVGDLLVKNMDFPGAEEMAERLRRVVPPNILGEGPTPQVQQLMAQNQHLTQMLENFTGLLAAKNLELKNKDEEITIKAMDAETRRIKEMGNAQENFEDLGLNEEFRALVLQAIDQALATRLPASVRKTDEELAAERQPELPLGSVVAPEIAAPQPQHSPLHPASQPRLPAGRIAPDGKEYVEHEPGKFARVEPPEEPQ